jgi:hypothetical protein
VPSSRSPSSIALLAVVVVVGLAAAWWVTRSTQSDEVQRSTQTGEARRSTPAAASDLHDIVARWQAQQAELGELSPEQHQQELARFMRDVPWEDLVGLCCEGKGTLSDSLLVVLGTLIRHRIDLAPPTLEEAATLIERHGCLEICKWPLVDWHFDARDSLPVAERERLSLALLAGGDDPELRVQLRRRFTTDGVRIAPPSLADTMLALAMAGARSGDATRATLATRMLGTTTDPRAPDSVAALLEASRSDASLPLDDLLEQCDARCAELATDRLIEIHQQAAGRSEERRQRLTVYALARAPRPEAARILLAAYDDGGTIVDSTFALPRATGKRYHQLWIATRIAEPHLVGWLRDGPPETARLAVELFDRALRFGPPLDAPAVVDGLASWRQRASQPDRSRATAVHQRAQSPPPVPGTRRPAARQPTP